VILLILKPLVDVGKLRPKRRSGFLLEFHLPAWACFSKGLPLASIRWWQSFRRPGGGPERQAL